MKSNCFYFCLFIFSYTKTICLVTLLWRNEYPSNVCVFRVGWKHFANDLKGFECIPYLSNHRKNTGDQFCSRYHFPMVAPSTQATFAIRGSRHGFYSVGVDGGTSTVDHHDDSDGKQYDSSFVLSYRVYGGLLALCGYSAGGDICSSTSGIILFLLGKNFGDDMIFTQGTQECNDSLTKDAL